MTEEVEAAETLLNRGGHTFDVARGGHVGRDGDHFIAAGRKLGSCSVERLLTPGDDGDASASLDERGG